MKRRLILAVTASLVLGAGLPALAQEPSASPENSGPDASFVASPSPTDPLRGTWDYQLTEEEVGFLAALFSPEEAAAVGIPGRSTSIRLGFDDERNGEGWNLALADRRDEHARIVST